MSDRDEGTAERSPRPSGTRAGIWVAAGAVLAALAASACCWLPLVLIAAGASAAGVAVTFERLRPLALGVAALLLGAAWVVTWRRSRRCTDEAGCDAERPRRRRTLLLLGALTAIVAALAAFPHYAAHLLPRGTGALMPASAAEVERVYRVAGMTCDACAAHAEAALLRVPGVLAADVSFRQGRAWLRVDARHAPSDAAIAAALERLGYRAGAVDAATGRAIVEGER